MIHDRAVDVVLFAELLVAVPVQLAGGGVGAVEELHEAHAFLDQAPGKKFAPWDTHYRGKKLVVCGHWGRSGPGNCTMSIPARGAYTFSELRAAGFNASDALAYAVDP